MMLFTDPCFLDFKKEWSRNRQVFLKLIETEKINYLFFQLNRHRFEATYLKPNFTLEKYSPQFSLEHANCQIIDIYNAILYRADQRNKDLQENGIDSQTSCFISFERELNLLFEDLFIRFAVVLDSLAKAIALFEKRTNTNCLWTSLLSQKGEDVWRKIIEEYKPLTDNLYKIRSDFLHGSVFPTWVVLNRCMEEGVINCDDHQNTFALNIGFHPAMKKIITFLNLGEGFSFFDFVYKVIEQFYCFEMKLNNSLIKVFCEKYIIKQYNELDGVVDYSQLTEYEEAIINEYLSKSNCIEAEL